MENFIVVNGKSSWFSWDSFHGWEWMGWWMDKTIVFSSLVMGYLRDEDVKICGTWGLNRHNSCWFMGSPGYFCAKLENLIFCHSSYQVVYKGNMGKSIKLRSTRRWRFRWGIWYLAARWKNWCGSLFRWSRGTWLDMMTDMVNIFRDLKGGV